MRGYHKKQDGQVALVVSLVVASVVGMYMVAESQKTNNMVQASKMRAVTTSLSRSNSNGLNLAASLMRFNEVPNTDNYADAVESTPRSLPALYPDPYFPIQSASLKLLRPAGSGGNWSFDANTKTVKINTKGYQGTKTAQLQPSNIKFGALRVDPANPMRIAAVQVESESIADISRLNGNDNVRRTSIEKALLTIPPPPRPSCFINATSNPPWTFGVIECGSNSPVVDPITGITTIVPTISGCLGNALSWDLEAPFGAMITLDVQTTGVVSQARTVTPTMPGFPSLAVMDIAPPAMTLAFLNPGNPNLPFPQAARISNAGGVIHSTSFVASETGGIAVEVTGPSGDAFTCGVMVHVADPIDPFANDSGDSFLGSTKILMDNGLYKTIDTIEIDDRVYNPASGSSIRVSGIYTDPIKDRLVTLHFANGVSLTVTDDHKFVVPQGAKIAANLKVGDQLLGFDSNPVEIVSIAEFTPREGDRVYDLILDKSVPYGKSAFVAEGMVMPTFSVQQFVEWQNYDRQILINVARTASRFMASPMRPTNLRWLDNGQLTSPIRIFRNPFMGGEGPKMTMAVEKR